MKSTIKFSLLGLTALALATTPLMAADMSDKTVKGEAKKEEKAATPSKAERAGVAVPFHGALKAKTDASITIQYHTRDLTIEVTSETKITKDGKPATLAEAVIGEDVGGQYRKREDKMIARSLRLGAKPEAPAKEKVKAPEMKPETKPTAKPAAPTVAPAAK